MKLLLDMNISPRWVAFLKANGIEAIHWLDCGSPNAADCEIMAYARENGFIVFTHDLDFSALLANTKASKPSVIQLRANDISPEAVGNIKSLYYKQYFIPLVQWRIRDSMLEQKAG